MLEDDEDIAKMSKGVGHIMFYVSSHRKHYLVDYDKSTLMFNDIK
jgi:hypothetical protein